jgi:hypothetical protein
MNNKTKITVCLLVFSLITTYAFSQKSIDTTKPTPISLYAGNKPGNDSTLVVVDGKVKGIIGLLKNEIDALSQGNSIKRVDILKDSMAIARYGEKGKHGVIQITTNTETTNKDKTTEQLLIPAEAVFDSVEVEAHFPDGDKAWLNYLIQNINAAVAADNKAPEGSYMVVIQFVVDKQGYLIDIKPLTNLGYGMEAEVIRVIRKSPRWEPAIQNGKPVRAYRKQPITFSVEAEKKKKLKRDKD